MRWPSRRPSDSSALLLPAAALLLGLTLLGSPEAALSGNTGEFVLLASPDVPVNELTLAEVQKIFSFKKTAWKPGHPVSVLLPESRLPSREFLLKTIYKMNDADLRRFILEKVFQGEIDLAPKVVRNDREAISFVASAHGLVAIVAADTPGLTGVKILRIDGLAPGDANYALKL